MRIARTVLSVGRDFVRDLRFSLFRYVTYRNANAKTRQVLHGSEEQAFNETGIATIYRVLTQALVFNFYDFFQEIFSAFGGVQEV